MRIQPDPDPQHCFVVSKRSGPVLVPGQKEGSPQWPEWRSDCADSDIGKTLHIC